MTKTVEMRCPDCGYSVTREGKEAAFCPNCGYVFSGGAAGEAELQQLSEADGLYGLKQYKEAAAAYAAAARVLKKDSRVYLGLARCEYHLRAETRIENYFKKHEQMINTFTEDMLYDIAVAEQLYKAVVSWNLVKGVLSRNDIITKNLTLAKLYADEGQLAQIEIFKHDTIDRLATMDEKIKHLRARFKANDVFIALRDKESAQKNKQGKKRKSGDPRIKLYFGLIAFFLINTIVGAVVSESVNDGFWIWTIISTIAGFVWVFIGIWVCKIE